jgi:hypothetical protein
MVKKAAVGATDNNELDEWFGPKETTTTGAPGPQMQVVTTSDGKEKLEPVDSGQKLTLHAPSSLWNYYGSFSVEVSLPVGVGYAEMVEAVEQWRENVIAVLLEAVPEEERVTKPTDKQIAFLSRLGYEGDAPKTMEEASALIDGLAGKAKAATPPNDGAVIAVENAASDKQMDLIEKLLSTKEKPVELGDGSLEHLSKREASEVINLLMAAPNKGKANVPDKCDKCGKTVDKPPQVKGTKEEYLKYITEVDESNSDKYPGHKPSGKLWCYECRSLKKFQRR